GPQERLQVGGDANPEWRTARDRSGVVAEPRMPGGLDGADDANLRLLPPDAHDQPAHAAGGPADDDVRRVRHRAPGRTRAAPARAGLGSPGSSESAGGGTPRRRGRSGPRRSSPGWGSPRSAS